MVILTTGFETAVRSRLGVDTDDLTDTELNQPLIVDLAEAIVTKRVPLYTSITDSVDLLYLQNAVVSQICALVCPSMPRRLNLKIAISDVKIEKEKINWEAMKLQFLDDVDANLGSITTVEVKNVSPGTHSLVNVIRNERKPI
jgi:hypothetical protein